MEAAQMQVVFVMGPTNSGKSTFLEKVSQAYPDQVGLVEVGKMMRAKYPPEYFQGSAAPEHTETEAWNMMIDKMREHDKAGKQVVLVDGQPRTKAQAAKVATMTFVSSAYAYQFVHLYCDADVRRARAEARDGHDKEKLALSIQRMTNDLLQLYEVFAQLGLHGLENSIWTFDTNNPEFDALEIIRTITSGLE